MILRSRLVLELHVLGYILKVIGIILKKKSHVDWSKSFVKQLYLVTSSIRNT